MVKPSRSAWRRMASIQRRSTWKVIRSVSWVVSLACSRVAFQNLRQVSALFGPDSPFLASFGAMLHYRPSATDLTTAQFISTLTGHTTVLAPSVTSTLLLALLLAALLTTAVVAWHAVAPPVSTLRREWRVTDGELRAVSPHSRH